jgi:hypothetical protein
MDDKLKELLKNNGPKLPEGFDAKGFLDSHKPLNIAEQYKPQDPLPVLRETFEKKEQSEKEAKQLQKDNNRIAMLSLGIAGLSLIVSIIALLK